MGYTSDDPRWIEAPVETKCGRCGAPINEGSKAYFYPEKQEALCNTPLCGQEAERLVQSQMGDN